MGWTNSHANVGILDFDELPHSVFARVLVMRASALTPWVSILVLTKVILPHQEL
jgi:hypothetical protein